MNAKLTLKLDEQVIQQAKRYAALNNRSLSGLVENYLRVLVTKSAVEDSYEEIQISPFVRQMTEGIALPLDLDPKELYHQYIEGKHL